MNSIEIILGCLSALWFLRTLLKLPASENVFGAVTTLIITGAIGFACFKAAFTPDISRLDSNKPKISIRRPGKFESGGCLRCLAGAVIGAALGVMLVVVWIFLNQPVVPPNVDGMNRYGGEIGMVMLGALVGGLTGACIGGSKPSNS